MIFGKKSAKADKKAAPLPTETAPEKYSLKEDDVYVMPNKFVAVKVPAPNTAKRGALVLVFLVILLGVIVAGGVWFINRYKPEPSNINNSNTNIGTNINNDADNNAEANNNQNININNNLNQDLGQNNQNNDIDINFNNNTNEEPIVVDLDIDKDGLTSLEETLYKTSPQVADTDKDGYSDGQELVNLYNPLVSGGKLAGSALVTKYSNISFGYELLYPAAWLVKSLNEDRSQVSLVPDSGTGETIDINVIANKEHLELLDWQKILYTSQSLDNFSLAGRPALRTADGLQVLLVTYDNVYTIIYDTTQADKNFMVTFNMVLSSFKSSSQANK